METFNSKRSSAHHLMQVTGLHAHLDETNWVLLIDQTGDVVTQLRLRYSQGMWSFDVNAVKQLCEKSANPK